MWPKTANHRLICFTISLALPLGLFGCQGVPWRPSSPYHDLASLEEGTILHVPTGIKVSREEMLGMLGSARIIYVGETHDNINAHRIQLEILKGLDQAFPGRVGVGMEMLRRPSQQTIDRWVQGNLEEADLFKEWLSSWGDDYRYYRSILRFVRDNKIPLIALNASKEKVSKILRGHEPGTEEKEEGATRYQGVSDPFHRRYARAIFEGHSHGSRDFETFYRVMLLWEETMARSVADFLKGPKGRDKLMLVFAGANHVEYGFGIPRRVFKRLRVPYKIVLPITPKIPEDKKDRLMDVDVPELPLPIADFVWAVPYEDMEKERARLGVELEKAREGIRITRVSETSAARASGLQEGDVILSMDGRRISSIWVLKYLLELKKRGDSSWFRIQRGKEILKLRVRF